MDKIAIVGVSCLFPGAATPQAFWQNLMNGRNSTSPTDEAQTGVDPAVFFDPSRQRPDTSYFMRGGYIRDFQFDPQGFDIPADTLAHLDQSAQWTLYVAREALRDSGHWDDPAVRERCGLILGNLSLPTRGSHHLIAPIYQAALGELLGDLLGSQPVELREINVEQGAAIFTPGYPAAAAARALGLGGVQFALDAACASSLYAVALACDYLIAGKADLMLAGAVSAADPLFVNMGFASFEAYPQDGQSRPLDASSGGLISGEGAGMLVLKRYADALRDGDQIYAVVSGIGLSNDGRGKHILTPNAKGQVLAFQRAFADAGLMPDAVQYVECHASGTPVGDKTELNSMETFFADVPQLPLIGSVKANLGHLLTVAGFASLLKIILSMAYGEVPATIGVEQPLTSQRQRFGGDQIVQHNRPWPGQTANRTAGVNAFGFGGVSAHMVLSREQTPQIQPAGNDVTKQSMTHLAIVGMDAHFGAADSLDTFARTIYEGRQHFNALPPQRWKGLNHQRELLQGFGFPNGEAPKGAYIDEFALDFMRFKLPPNAADQPVPQQLLLLKVADRAVQDANLPQGANVAVIVATGSELSLHQARARLDLSWQIQQGLAQQGIALTPELVAEVERIAKNSLHTPAEVNHYTSHIGNIVSSRVAALWDFSGPAFTVSAEENSVFKALEVAQLMLTNGEVDAVVVGAVDLSGGAENVLLRQQIAAVNTGTATMSFDDAANGWLVGEGAGAIVLKRADRVTPQDRVYAVIDAVQIQQDQGATPSAERVAQTARAAMQDAGVTPNEIGYLEAHASGFNAEDQAETAGLLAAYRGLGDLTTAIGTVKANIGHTFAASGIASLIKTALALHGRYLPAVPGWNGARNAEQWQGSPFYTVTQSKSWFTDAGVTTRRAAISGLGADGAASHVILSEAPRTASRRHSYLQEGEYALVLLAGANAAALEQELNALESALNGGESVALIANRAFARFKSQSSAAYRLALVGRTAAELNKEVQLARAGVTTAIRDNGEWHTPAGSYFTAKPLGEQGKVAFVYPGAFNSYPRLGQDLFALFPDAYDHFHSLSQNIGGIFADRLIAPRSLEKMSRKGWNAARTALENDPVAMMESGMAYAALFTRILQDYFKLQPASAFGYSLGEGSMHWALGVWNQGDAGSAAMHASPLFKDRLFGRKQAVREIWGLDANAADDFWAAYFISAPAEKVSVLVEREARVFLTHINTPREVMIAGDPEACKRVAEASGGDYLRAPFSVVIHCEAVLPEYQSFFNLHHYPIANRPVISFYSAADYAPSPLESTVLAHNMARIVSKPVDFPRLIERVYNDGARIFIELGPRSTCARWIDETLGKREHLAVSFNQIGVDDRTAMIRMMARFASHRVPLDLSPLYQPVSGEQERSLVKTVTLGGETLQSVILTDENRQKFAGAVEMVAPALVARVQTAQPVAAVNAPATGGYLGTLQARQTGLRDLAEQMRQQLAAAQQGQTLAPIVAAPVPVPAAPEPVAPPAPKLRKPALFQLEDIEQFALGSVATCFGDRYHIYDDRRAPRVPNTDLLLITRVLSISGERYASAPGSTIVAEYDVPADAWFYRDNAHPTIPYSVYMEIALQPCGFLSAYHGPTLDFPDIDFYFRNLDGQGKLLREIDLRNQTITNTVKLVNSTTMQGIIIQKFTFEMSHNGTPFYVGDATFGYFSQEGLASQAGLDRGKATQPWFVTEQTGLQTGAISPALYQGPSGKPFYHLPAGQLHFIDNLLLLPNGGKHGKGYIYSGNAVDPADWFFRCHFYQDPVMPGSLGVESIMQSMQAFALSTGLGSEFRSPFFTHATDHNTVWRYRGQVLSSFKRVDVEVHVTDIVREAGQITVFGDASLWRRDDSLRIYEIKGAAIRIAEAQT